MITVFLSRQFINYEIWGKIKMPLVHIYTKNQLSLFLKVVLSLNKGGDNSEETPDTCVLFTKQMKIQSLKADCRLGRYRIRVRGLVLLCACSRWSAYPVMVFKSPPVGREWHLNTVWLSACLFSLSGLRDSKNVTAESFIIPPQRFVFSLLSVTPTVQLCELGKKKIVSCFCGCAD